jgi:hypothetical protein
MLVIIYYKRNKDIGRIRNGISMILKQMKVSKETFGIEDKIIEQPRIIDLIVTLTDYGVISHKTSHALRPLLIHYAFPI